jgi:hypothetical protein
VKFCSVPPGVSPLADAYNLMVCAWYAEHQPKLASEAERMAKTISRNVNDWEEIAGYLALLAMKSTHFVNEALPEDYVKGSERWRLAIEEHERVPA